MVEVFKTNVDNKEDAQKILKEIDEHFPNYQVNFDLEDCDKILRVKARRIEVNLILQVLHKNNFTGEILQ